MRARGLLRIFGLLFCVLAVSNLLKPLELSEQQGFVFLGQRLRGTANLVMGPLMGCFLLAYGIGVLGLRRWALPLAVGYAVWVVVNLVLFSIRMPEEASRSVAFGLAYTAVAIGVSAGSAWLLYQRRATLT